MMIYCVVKGTTRLIDGSENNRETMLVNATAQGFSEAEVEFLPEDEYALRVAQLDTPESPLPTLEEQVKALSAAVIEMAGELYHD